MVLYPNLPFHEDETPVSWACRLSALHTGGGLHKFLEDQRISLYGLIDGRDAALERLADVAGADFCALKANALVVAPDHMIQLRGFELPRNFTTRQSIRVCPQCLMDDTRDKSEGPRVYWRGRYLWNVTAVRTCPLHHKEIVTIGQASTRAQFFDVSRLLVDGGFEAVCQREIEERSPSPLQNWVVSRLLGDAEREDWLHRQPIDQAVRTCEMLGAILEFGPEFNLKAMSERDWDRAGAVGFSAAIRGEEGIRELLTEIQRRPAKGNAGPQAVFGRLYQWLGYVKSEREPGPIKDILRKHIIETMAVGEGEVVLGVRVKRRLIHSIYSLSITSGLHPKRLRKAVFAVGLASEELSDRSNNQVTFDAEAGDRLAKDLLDSVPQRELPKYLGCSRTHARALADAGILTPVIGRDPKLGLGQKAFSRSALDKFLTEISAEAALVSVADPGLHDITAAASRATTNTATVIRLLLDRQLDRVQRVAGERGIAALRLDPGEIRDALDPDYDQRDCGVARTAKLLHTTERVVTALIEPNFGEPFLPSRCEKNGRHKQSIWTQRRDITAFQSKYVSLTNLSREQGVQVKKLMKLLEARGINPVGDWRRIKARLYRRSDIVELIE